MKQSRLIVLIALAFLAACRPALGEIAPTIAPTADAPTADVPTGAPATAALTPAEPVTPTDEPSTPPATDATAPLFDIDPFDRSPFAAGLISDEAGGDALPGAPVYHMAITIDPSMTLITGRQTLTYTNNESVDLNEVYFHLHAKTLDGDITVSAVTVDGAPAAAEVVGDMLRVPLAAPLAPGDVTTIDMAFETTVPTDIGRNYGVLAYYDDILALAHFYPMLAVYDEEGWNTTAPDVQGDLTYSDSAFYLVRVTALDGLALVATGSIVDETVTEGTQTLTFAAGPARDFYLVAGDFAVVSETVGETTINSYAPPDMADGAAMALDVAAAALESATERLSAYPYRELDIVTTPTSALGIEYPGLIVGTVNMYDISATTSAGVPYEAILESTIAHEVMHQWFYNLVGNDQLDEPWLDESVVGYSTYRYFVDRYGQDVGDNYFQNFLGRWDRVERAEIPIGRPVAAYEGAEYSAIVYGRGAVFVRELEEAMGREAFDAFLRAYVTRFRWDVATTSDFRAMAEEQCGCDLGDLFAKFINE